MRWTQYLRSKRVSYVLAFLLSPSLAVSPASANVVNANTVATHPANSLNALGFAIIGDRLTEAVGLSNRMLSQAALMEPGEVVLTTDVIERALRTQDQDDEAIKRVEQVLGLSSWYYQEQAWDGMHLFRPDEKLSREDENLAMLMFALYHMLPSYSSSTHGS